MTPSVLSVAGSDPSGGAGLQADLKTFADHGVYGMAAPTAITVQNTQGVHGVHVLSADLVRAQVAAVIADIPPAAIKLGMLGDPATPALLGPLLERAQAPVVLDPVLRASSGAILTADPARVLHALTRHLTLITPNLPEQKRLFPDGPESWVQRTGVAMLVKGGHGDGHMCTDALYLPNGEIHQFTHPRIETRNTHGTGCTLSSAIAARLALGDSLLESVRGAISYLHGLLRQSTRDTIGRGPHGPIAHHPQT